MWDLAPNLICRDNWEYKYRTVQGNSEKPYLCWEPFLLLLPHGGLPPEQVDLRAGRQQALHAMTPYLTMTVVNSIDCIT